MLAVWNIDRPNWGSKVSKTEQMVLSPFPRKWKIGDLRVNSWSRLMPLVCPPTEATLEESHLIRSSKVQACTTNGNMGATICSKPFQSAFMTGLQRSFACPFAFYHDPFAPGSMRQMLIHLHGLGIYTSDNFSAYGAAERWSEDILQRLEAELLIFAGKRRSSLPGFLMVLLCFIVLYPQPVMSRDHFFQLAKLQHYIATLSCYFKGMLPEHILTLKRSNILFEKAI